MSNFLKRLFSGEKRQITETAEIPADKLQIAENAPAEEPGEERKLVDTELSLHPDWEVENEKVSFAQKELMEKEVAAMPPIKEGAITINGIYAVRNGDQLEVGIYIRNAMSRNLVLGRAYLAVTDLEGNVLARQMFNLSEMGEIPPYSIRPWELYYNAENLFVEEVKYDNWKLAFEIDESLSDEISPVIQTMPPIDPEQIELALLKEYAEQLPAMEAGQMDFNLYRARFDKEGNLNADIVVRSANQESITINELPLAIEDEQGNDVAMGIFSWPQGLEVAPFTVTVKNLEFPAQAVLLKDANLKRCSVYIKK
jgi:SLAP domain-containing protein